MNHIHDLGSTDYKTLEQLSDLSNREAWDKFLKAYGPAIRLRCRSFGIDLHTVEDIESEIRIRLLGVFTDPEKRIKSTFRGYLESVIRSAVSDYFRTKYLERKIEEIEYQRQRDLQEQENKLLEVSDEFEILIVNRLVLLDRAIAQVQSEVTKIQWDMFHSFVFRGTKAVEVAETMNRTISTVYKNREFLMKKVINKAKALSNESR